MDNPHPNLSGADESAIAPAIQFADGLTKVSAANPLQTRSVSLERFSEKLGVLEESTLEEILLALGIVIQCP